jgi:hypothetical protein
MWERISGISWFLAAESEEEFSIILLTRVGKKEGSWIFYPRSFHVFNYEIRKLPKLVFSQAALRCRNCLLMLELFSSSISCKPDQTEAQQQHR